MIGGGQDTGRSNYRDKVELVRDHDFTDICVPLRHPRCFFRYQASHLVILIPKDEDGAGECVYLTSSPVNLNDLRDWKACPV